MQKIEDIEFDSYELNPNDYFFDITPNMVAMMQLTLEGAEDKKQHVYVPNEDYTIVEGVTTNGVINAIMKNDRDEYERMMELIRLKLNK